MAFSKEVAIPKSIFDLVEERAQIIKDFASIDRQLNIAKERCNQINRYIYPVQSFRAYNGIEAITRDIDRRMWRHTIEMTGFNRYMDKVARNEFEQSLESNPPEFTIANVRSTLIESYNMADTFMKRGIVQLFRSLGANYKTNNVFKIKNKIILRNWFTVFCGSLSVNYHCEPEMNDLDRVIRTLDNKEFNEHEFSGAMRKVAHTMQYENEYFKVKAFKNGNAHLWFKRDDLVDQINDIIQEYYGEGKLG